MNYLLPEVEENLKTVIDKQLVNIKDITVSVTIEVADYNLILNGEALRWYLQGVIDTEKKLTINKYIPEDF